jgi:malonate decarboxylase delta subunit
MQILEFNFPAELVPARRLHLGVVASGDLEILLEPPPADDDAAVAHVRVRTSVDGFDTTWHRVLQRFFERAPVRGRWELNDFGATPGTVALRLRQAAWEATADSASHPDGAS